MDPRGFRELALAHAARLVEDLIDVSRAWGLLPGGGAAADPLGPICVGDDEVATILASLTARPAGGAPARSAATQEARRRLREALTDGDPAGGFARCVERLALDDGALDLLTLLAAAEWDGRFCRLFGFLNNDATQVSPTWAQLRLLVDDPAGLAPLLERGLLVAEPKSAPLPARLVRLAPYAAATLAETLVTAPPESPDWDDLHWPAAEKEALREGLLRELGRSGGAPRLVLLEGTRGSGRRAAVAAAARAAARPLVTCDLAGTRGTAAERTDALAAACFRAMLAGAVVAVRWDGGSPLGDGLLATVERQSQLFGVTALVLLRPQDAQELDAPAAAAVIRMRIPTCGALERRQTWVGAAAARGLVVEERLLDEVAGTLRLTPGRIHQLAAELAERKQLAPSLAQVGDALREVTLERLGTLATRHEGAARLDDLVLDEPSRARLDELADRVRYRLQVLERWGCGGGGGRGRGVSALFVGPPGTGKTAAAAAVAQALGVDLFVVELPRIVSKWVGETEQNLARLFDEAESSNVALLFDEADALFGKRTHDAKSANDRFANLTVNYLLQRMEVFSGLAVLTTNLESAMDQAFARRITCRIELPMPSAELRQRLWERLRAAAVTYAPDVDLRELARRYVLPGARIKNALLRAAFAAAGRGAAEPILDHALLDWAATSELEDMGRVVAAQPVRRLASAS